MMANILDVIRGAFELASCADWISPTIGAAKDAKHFATGVHGTLSISVRKGELWQAEKVLKKSNYQGDIGPTVVVSATTAPFDQEALITIECHGGADGYESVRGAMAKLAENNIECWVG